jgi:CubicO group peptidase (beta-lactamase class C family)
MAGALSGVRGEGLVMQRALVIRHGDRTVHEEFGADFTARTPHALFSGTKSFWGIAAIEAAYDGILSLDDRVRGDITARMLLNLTAGYGFGGLGSAVPAYDRAWEIVPKDPPGRRFTYGGIPLQVFGKYFAEKLGREPHDYLRERVLEPAGVRIAAWRTLKDGTHPLPTGAQLDAENWLRYGTYVLRNRERFARAFEGSKPNPRYGLAWWLASGPMPSDTFYASGSGGQALYVIPSRELVAVRFSDGGSPNHPATVRRVLAMAAPA